MAGHNKWSKIKRTKGVADIKRGKLFTKLLREIQVSARMGGGDPRSNPRLRDAIAEARANNMPKDNIERAVKRGMGELDGSNYEQITYEGYGPGGAAILIEALTDNRNRTVADLRAIMVRNGGNLGEAGSVGWMFSKKGTLIVPKADQSEEKVMELALDSGAEDIQDDDDSWQIFTPPEKLDAVKSVLESQGIGLQSATQTLTPQNTIELQGEAAEQMIKLIDLIEDLDDVQKVYSNFDISDQELARIS
jgi:YebC/PmpR family DNA-binding regulatory protein